MGKSNKSIKDAMVKKYGRKCFIEELRLRTKEEIESDLKNYKKAKRKELCMLTFHHIKERRYGGSATEENGAILRNINHIWFNNLTREEQARINKLFQEYKLNFMKDKCQAVTAESVVITEPKPKPKVLLGVAELYNGKVRQAQIVESEQEIVIPVYDITDEEYEKYIKARRERERVKWHEIGHDFSPER